MIPSFTDTANKVWQVELTTGALKRVRTVTGIELGSILTDEPRLAKLLYAEPEPFANVLFEICRTQLDGLDGDGFLERLNPDALEGARQATVEAIANFTLPPAISKAFVANWRNAVTARAETLAGMVTTELRRLTSKEPVTPSPASSGSTRRRSRSGNSSG